MDRPIPPRCLECHATYFDARQVVDEPTNQYDTTAYILGITCKKCHGGGHDHVARQGSPMLSLAGQGIVNPADLSRERQIDGCALCHGGIGESIQPPFSYPPGAALENYLHQPTPAPAEAVDVHGNQVALLKESQCYVGSETMTCSTCHDVHEPQRGLAAFAANCLSCHEVRSCGLFPEHGHAIASECVSCHMPELPARSIVATQEGRPVRPPVRTHRIGVYPDPSEPEQLVN